MILVIDTANKEAFIGLWKNNSWVGQETFTAGRELNSLILQKLQETFQHSAECWNVDGPNFNLLSGIIVNSGPGSFTGLRIGISVANTIAYSKNIPIVGVEAGENGSEYLLQKGLKMLESAGSHFKESIVPQYGAEPNITTPKTRT
jgi:tRNA threonylcarbamoyladenosine biosynthesis protein TsaB